MRRPHTLVGLVLFWNAVVLAGFVAQLSLSPGSSSFPALLAVATFFSSAVVDVLLVAAVGALLGNGALPMRLVAYGVFLVHFLANVLQLGAHFIGGQYLSRLAVANANHVSLVLSPARIAASAAAVAVALLVPLLSEIAGKRVPWRESARLALVPLALSGAVALVPLLLPRDARRIRDEMYDGNNITDRSPLLSLIDVVTGTPKLDRSAFTPADALAARRYGFQISFSNDYPLRKEWIYEGDPPFPGEPGAPRLPNVIVFFTEGMSARLTGPYGSPFPGITPNLDRFAADPKTMLVTNYYNHTAATYRGLHGQLCSLYPKDEGSDTWLGGPENGSVRSYFSLANYLGELGYETDFLDTHRREAARVDDMVKRLGFENVLTAEDLSARYLGGAEPLRGDGLSDHQLLDALVGFLGERKESGSESRPFFVGLYNIETHAFQDAAPDGSRYGDGRNYCLNTVHSFDHAFGRFLDVFLRSPLAQNTVVVFTADHCHYPERTYVEAIRPFLREAPRVFVDTIPLLIYSPVHRLPHAFDAEFRTSLDFAPSLIHLLGLPQRPNPFLGDSIFSPRARHERGPGIASIGGDLYFVERDGIVRKGRLREHAKEFWRVQRLMRWLADLEERNRIWPAPDAEGGQSQPRLRNQTIIPAATATQTPQNPG